MLTGFEGRLAKVAPGLAGHPAAENARGARELATGDVARKCHGLASPTVRRPELGRRRRLATRL